MGPGNEVSSHGVFRRRRLPGLQLKKSSRQQADDDFILNPEIETTDYADDTDGQALGATVTLTHWVNGRR